MSSGERCINNNNNNNNNNNDINNYHYVGVKDNNDDKNNNTLFCRITLYNLKVYYCCLFSSLK